MPLYEYQCSADGRFELIQKFSDPPLEACPTCGGPVEKLVAAPAIQFKGSGWYVTDYARKGKEGKAETKDGKNGEAKSTDSSASKDAKSGTGTPTTSTPKDSSAPKGGSPT